MAKKSYRKVDDRFYDMNEAKSVVALPAGVYKIGQDPTGVYLKRMKVTKDEIVVLPDMGADEILGEIDSFWASKEHYEKLGAVHKRGIIMEGPPGSGKTSTVALLVDRFTKERDGVVLSIHDVDHIEIMLNIVRKTEPDRPVMVLIEDMEDALRRGSESKFLNVLDGRDQTEGVVFVATTNHLDQLPDRIANRPSRFDLVIKIGFPTKVARRAFLDAKVGHLGEQLLEYLASKTKGFSIAHLKELLILTQVYRMDVRSALERIEAIVDRKLLPSQAKLKAGKNDSEPTFLSLFEILAVEAKAEKEDA